MTNPGGRSSGPSGGFLGSFLRYWRRSYASEYLGFALLVTGYLLIQFFVEPFHRMFSLNDLRISFPFAEVERVPLTHDFVYALLLPFVMLLLYNRLTTASTHKHHVSILGLAISLVLAAFLTDIIKNGAGRPRPDLLARCKPKPGTPQDALVTFEVCTETRHHKLHDGWRSFPSGHSSFSFAGLGYLSLFLAGQLRIFSHGTHGEDAGDGRIGEGTRQHAQKLLHGDLPRALVCLVPLVGATMIAISRCQDYRHDVYDVCVGGVLGWTVAYWSYRRYWPRLSSSRSDEPYAEPPAAEMAMVNGAYGRVRDEEEGLSPNAD